jgi:putative polyhydroxyalkanoate system protein
MPDIRMHREHQLGLAKARKVAGQWAEQVEREFNMQCTVTKGEAGDTVDFSRSGVKGTLVVTADSFELHARLGLLLGVFSRNIEAEIEKTLDALLVKAAPEKRKPAAKRAAAKKASARK